MGCAAYGTTHAALLVVSLLFIPWVRGPGVQSWPSAFEDGDFSPLGTLSSTGLSLLIGAGDTQAFILVRRFNRACRRESRMTSASCGCLSRGQMRLGGSGVKAGSSDLFHRACPWHVTMQQVHAHVLTSSSRRRRGGLSDGNHDLGSSRVGF